MLISSTIFYVVLAITFLTFVISGIVLNKFYGKKIFRFIFTFAGLGIAFLMFMTLSAVYTVESCSQYKSERLIFPKTLPNGFQLGFGKSAYVYNASENDLYLQTIQYGTDYNSNDDSNLIIKPQQAVKTNGVTVDYIFQNPPSSIQSKSSSESKQYLGCKEAGFDDR